MEIQASDWPNLGVSRGSIPLLSRGRVRLRVHVALVAYSVAAVLITLGGPLEDTLVALIVQGPALWISVLLHELGKVLVALSFGVKVGDVILWPVGGLTVVGGSPQLRTDVAIACAGPLSHVPLILALYGSILAGGFDRITAADTSQTQLISRSLYGSMWLNVAIAVLNCVTPAFPLDAARVVVDLQVMTGASIPDAVGVLVFLAMPAVPMLAVFGVYAIGSKMEMAAIICTMALWVYLQARTVLYCKQLGIIFRYPLFAHLPHQTPAFATEAALQPLVEEEVAAGATAPSANGSAPSAQADAPPHGEETAAQPTLVARGASGSLARGARDASSTDQSTSTRDEGGAAQRTSVGLSEVDVAVSSQ